MPGGSFHHVRPEAYAYAWDNGREPALEVDPFEAVAFQVRDASDEQINETSTAEAVSRLDFDHVNPVSGPVFVRGARPGDVLEVEIVELRPSSWGWTAIIPGFGFLADEFPDPWLRISRIDAAAGVVRFGDDITLPWAPFPGTIGVAPDEPGPHSIVPPSRFGGNMDIRHLRAGARLLLPVGVEGALLSVGDTHAAQGDGEVCGTAVETAMEIVLRPSIRRDLRIDAPQYVLPATPPDRGAAGPAHVCTGVGPDLWEAGRDAVRAGISYLQDHHGLDREEAYAVCSVACDLRIHEVVDAPNWVVGLVVPLSIFGGDR